MLGLLLIIPLLRDTFPLLSILWTTRSDDAVSRSAYYQTNQSALPERLAEDIESGLEEIGHLPEEEIEEMLAAYFGERPPEPAAGDGQGFDADSGNFERIHKVLRKKQGKSYHVYIVQMKDRFGRRSRFVEAFEKPDPGYERTMQLLGLIENNSQLRAIYNGMLPYLDRKSAEADPPAESPDNPAVEMGHEWEQELLRQKDPSP